MVFPFGTGRSPIYSLMLPTKDSRVNSRKRESLGSRTKVPEMVIYPRIMCSRSIRHLAMYVDWYFRIIQAAYRSSASIAIRHGWEKALLRPLIVETLRPSS